MASMVERMVAIVRRQPEGMTAHQVELALIAEPNCPQSDNLVGFCASVLKAARMASGEPVFKAVSRGVYTVNEQFPTPVPIEDLDALYVLQNDSKQFWPREGVTMLTHELQDAAIYTEREAADRQKARIHDRNPKGPFPWSVLEFRRVAV